MIICRGTNTHTDGRTDNRIMINNCVEFNNKILNKNLMSIVNMNYMYVYGSYRNPALVFMTI